jgi:hypothetical protein
VTASSTDSNSAITTTTTSCFASIAHCAWEKAERAPALRVVVNRRRVGKRVTVSHTMGLSLARSLPLVRHLYPLCWCERVNTAQEGGEYIKSKKSCHLYIPVIAVGVLNHSQHAALAVTLTVDSIISVAESSLARANHTGETPSLQDDRKRNCTHGARVQRFGVCSCAK